MGGQLMVHTGGGNDGTNLIQVHCCRKGALLEEGFQMEMVVIDDKGTREEASDQKR